MVKFNLVGLLALLTAGFVAPAQSQPKLFPDLESEGAIYLGQNFQEVSTSEIDGYETQCRDTRNRPVVIVRNVTGAFLSPQPESSLCDPNSRNPAKVDFVSDIFRNDWGFRNNVEFELKNSLGTSNAGFSLSLRDYEVEFDAPEDQKYFSRYLNSHCPNLSQIEVHSFHWGNDVRVGVGTAFKERSRRNPTSRWGDVAGDVARHLIRRDQVVHLPEGSSPIRSELKQMWHNCKQAPELPCEISGYFVLGPEERGRRSGPYSSVSDENSLSRNMSLYDAASRCYMTCSCE